MVTAGDSTVVEVRVWDTDKRGVGTHPQTWLAPRLDQMKAEMASEKIPTRLILEQRKMICEIFCALRTHKIESQ